MLNICVFFKELLRIIINGTINQSKKKHKLRIEPFVSLSSNKIFYHIQIKSFIGMSGNSFSCDSPRGSGCGTALGGGTTYYLTHSEMQGSLK